MVIRFKDFQQELDEVGRQDAVRARAESTASSMSPVQLMRLESQYQTNPQLPVDAHLALAQDPAGPALFEKVSMRHAAQGMTPTIGAPLTANQLRYMNASEGERNQIDRVYASIAGRLVNGPASGWQNTIAAVSDAADGPAGLIQGALQRVPGSDTAYEGLKGFSRNVMPVLDAPMQLTQATGRQVAAGVTDAASGDVGGALGHLARAQIGGPAGIANIGLNMDQTDVGQWARERGEQAGGLFNRALGRDYEINSDIGTGFFANENSAMVERRKEAERKMGVLPNGQTYTIGRSVATGVGFDPEGTSYNVLSGLLDATVAVGVPGVEGGLVRGLKGAKGGARALLGGVDESEFLISAGAHRGLYTQVDLDRAVDFVTSERSSGLVDFMVNSSGDRGWMEMWEATGRGNLDPYTVSRLTDAADPDDVRRILVAAIQNGGRPTLTTAPTRALQNISRAAQHGGTIRRLGGQVPENTINLMDPGDAVNTVLDFGRNVKADRSMIDSWAAAMGRAPDEIARREVYTQMLGETAEMLSRGGLPEGRARSLTQYMQTELETSRALFDDALNMDVNAWSNRAIGDGNLRLPPITLLQEAATELPLPSARDLRRATSWARPLWELAEDPSVAARFTRVLGKGWETTVDGLMMLQSKWKDMRLLRLGYPLRVLPEEQLRRLAAGHTTLSHPAGLFGAMLGNPRIGDDIDDAMRGVRNALDGTALSDDDIFQAAMADSRLAGLRDGGRNVVRNGPRSRVFADGNTDEFLVGWNDELRLLASDPVASRVSRGGVDETLEFLTGRGGEIRDKLVSLDPSLADDLTLRQYLETVANRVQAVTGGSDDLLQAVQRGDFENVNLSDLMDFAPESVVMRSVLDGDGVNAYDRAVGAIFDVLAAAPTNKLSRAPVFRSAYESRLVELAPLAAKPDELLAAARRANVTQDAYEMIEAGIRSGAGRGTLQLTHLDTLAKKGALDEVRGLLYDVTRSSQFFDQARLLFPFGEAWKEVVTTWARLFSEDPFTIQRFAGLTGRALTSNDTGQTYFDIAGLDRESDTGFFYENEYGDMVFYYPWSQELTETLSGVPFRLEGGARNLNLAGEILPGLGPYAQIAAYNVLPNNTTWDPIREKLFPYGNPASMEAALDYLPAWAGTIIRGLKGGDQLTVEQQRLYGNTQMRVMRYLWSTGNYSAENQQEFWDDVESATQRLFLTRGFVQAAAPASPQIASTIIGPDGELLDQAFLMDEYMKLTEADFETALEQFMATYGEGALLIPQGNTVSTRYGGTPLEGAGYDWVRDNPQVADDHPELFGFFAPAGEGSEFSNEAYLRSLSSGERVQLSNEEKLAMAQHRWASNQYRRVRDLIEGTPTPEQQAILDTLRADLKERYPGYGRVDGIGGRSPVYQVVDSGDVDRALADPVLTATPAGQALETYWGFRAEVVAAAEAAGFRTIGSGGWRSSNDAAPYRDLLRSLGDELASDEPEFARMWDLFLSQEFEEPEDE